MVHSLLCLNQLIYAVYTTWSQFTLQHFTVEFLLFSRMFSGCLQIWAASLWLDRRSRQVHDQSFAAVWGSWAELAKVWVLGGVVFILNVYMFLTAVKYTNAVVTAVAQCTTPVMTSVISIVIGAEPFSWLQMFGFALAVAGNVVQLDVWNTKSRSGGNDYAVGIAAMFINVLSFSVFLVFSKPFMRRLPMLIVYRQMIVVGMVGTLILTLAVRGRGAFEALGSATDGWAIGGYVFAVVIMAYVPYAIVGFAMTCNVPPPLMAAHIIFQPVFTAVVSAIALGTVLKWYQYVGGVLAVAAVSITMYLGMLRFRQQHRSLPFE
jgi:drug/metabolite transporter (DMT)-like permease